MGRRSCIAVSLLSLALSGCSTGRLGSPGTSCAAPRTSVVLFDARPGWPSAADLADRSTWPATPSWYDDGESVVYYERFVDVQYGGQGGSKPRDYVYRRFDTYRVGHAGR